LAKLGHVANAYPYQLSGGMKRRLTFLSAIAPDPEVLLMDEPFSSVDEPTRVGIHRDVFNIARRAEKRMSIVLVTHDLAEALALADRVIMLSGDRPSSVAGSYEVPFGDDRDVIRIREEPKFLEMYATVWHELAKQIEIGSAREGSDV
jgi:ABC-type nitrate/sulfonate/bicarbonate transport system ATPase subunit